MGYSENFYKRNETIANDLYENGWAVCEQYIPDNLCGQLLDDLSTQLDAGRFTPAGIGRDGAGEESIRNDKTLWLTGKNSAPAEFLNIMGNLRADLNRRLFLGLFEYEAHYARYEAGGFYKKHVDALHGDRNRLVSTVTYLTSDWAEADGGHLVLYDGVEQDCEMARILPKPGTLAVFLSEEVPHEVLPPTRPRQSIAGWFRCNSSINGRVDPLR